MKKLLVLICVLCSLCAMSWAQANNLEDVYDPAGILRQQETTTLELWEIKEQAITNWPMISQVFVSKERAQFFQLDDPISFVDYLSGAYEHPGDSMRIENAMRVANEAILFAEALPDNAREEGNLELMGLIQKAQDFYTVRYCPDTLKKRLYWAWKRLQRAVYNK